MCIAHSDLVQLGFHKSVAQGEKNLHSGTGLYCMLLHFLQGQHNFTESSKELRRANYQLDKVKTGRRVSGQPRPHHFEAAEQTNSSITDRRGKAGGGFHENTVVPVLL